MQPMIGHVQVSQVPARDSPDNEGEINFDYFFRLMAKLPIDLIGLEYKSEFHPITISLISLILTDFIYFFYCPDTSKETFDWLAKYRQL
jgi:hypothetical protein